MTDLKATAGAQDPVADADAEATATATHRAWMNSQIEQALEHQRSGKATFKTLEETRRQFGL